MAVTPRADLIYALIGRLRNTSEVAAIASDRVSGRRQTSWNPMPKTAVLLKRAGGPPGQYLIGQWVSRIDIKCYGPTDREATELMDVVLDTLCPAQGRQGSFAHACGVRVSNIAPETDVLVSEEPDAPWPFALLPVLVYWSGVAVP